MFNINAVVIKPPPPPPPPTLSPPLVSTPVRFAYVYVCAVPNDIGAGAAGHV